MKKRFIITESILGLIIIICLVSLCITIYNKKNNQIDYDQKITDVSGEEFKPNYDAERDSDFSFRLADMECNDDCSNVSKVKIGDKELKLGEDYEVKRGSIIIVIYKKVMQALLTGKTDITIDIEKDGKIVTVGVQITITNNKTQEEQLTEESQENQPVATETGNNNNNNDQNTSAPTPTPAPTQPEKPKTCSELQNCDYNLNDRYVIETDKYNFYRLPEGVANICDQNETGTFYVDILPVVEARTFYQIGVFTGQGGSSVPHVTPTRTDTTYNQAQRYAASKGLTGFHDGWGCGGKGDIVRSWTWQETIDRGFALDEAKCAAWGLSCGRW